MTVRDELRPPFNRLPKWLLVVISVVSLPVWLIRGMCVAFIEHFGYWKIELYDILDLDKEPQ
jgi:hypothetical protein